MSTSFGVSSIPRQHRRQLKTIGFYLLIVLVIAVLIFPLYWMVVTALRPENQIFAKDAILIPNTLVLDNFINIFADSDFVTYYKNSIVVSIGVVSLTTVLATLGGYGLSRMESRLRIVFARGVLLGYMFPPILLGIPMYILWRQIGVLNTYIGLILAETALALPFSLWLMWKFFQTIPYSHEEAAQVMGASEFRAFYDVVLPLSKPGFISVAIFSYAISWNAFTIPKIILTNSDRWVLTVGIASFTEGFMIVWTKVMAASAMTILPAFIFVYFLQKYMLRGFRAGGIG
jgi:multiple sugar transport system permease protein